MAYTITIDEVTSDIEVANNVQSIEIQEVVNNILVENAVTELTISNPSYPITVEYNAVQLDGIAATIAVGTTTTGAAGTNASVTNSGDSTTAVFDFTIPRGATGATGSAATVTVGTTTTGAAGSSASVTNSGTSSAAVFNFTVPRGDTGATGATGSQGPQGDKGDKGDTGNTGAQGATGAAATIAVGTVTTGAAGSSVTITNAGTSGAAVFNFSIPRGDTGATGAQGASLTIEGSKATVGDLPGTGTAGEAWIVQADGDLYVWNTGTSSWDNVGQIVGPQGNTGATGATGAAGAAASIQVGTVTTGSAGSSATITNSGTSSAAIFDFSIPRGDTGATGATGAGVATGGTTGQVLAKIDGTNYNTQWVNQTVDTNTTYSQNVTATTGGANLNLAGSDSTTDTVKFAGGTGITVAETDANTITITNLVTDTNTTYAISAETVTGGANLRLTGSDASTDNVTIAAGTNVTVTRTDANTITIAATAGSSTISETLRTLCYNADSVTLTKGMPVYVFGAQGQNIAIKRADNDGDAESAQTLGLVEADIAAGAEGYVVTFGEIENLNTSTYTEGAAFYLGSTPGTITFTKPYAPNHLVYLGFVEKANASSGRVFVKVQNGYELDELHNVNIDHNVSSANKDYLVYNSVNSLWENRQLDIVNDTTPQLGGNLDVNGYSLVSTSSGNISLVPNGTGNIVLNTNTSTGGLVRVGDGTNQGAIVANGAVDLLLLADPEGASQASLLLEAATGDVRFGPGGSGSVRNTADKTYFGTGSAATTLTSNGAYNLTINTNDGTSSPSILLTQGTNGGITMTASGSGQVITNSTGTGLTVARRTTSAGTASTVAAVQRNYTAGTLSTMDGHISALAFSQRDSATTQSFYTRIGGVYSTTGAHSHVFEKSSDNFTTSTRQLQIADDTVILGATSGTTAQVITTYGSQDLNLVTNQGTNSGYISIAAGLNADITIAPEGTGTVIISGNLQVDGTTTTVNSTTLDVDDINITLAKGAANAAAANGGGITLEGPTTAATITYTSADDRWNMNKSLNATLYGNVTGNVTGDINTNTIAGVTTNGAIAITPNGTGDVQLVADTVQVGDSNALATITTNGTGSLRLNTNSGTSSPVINLVNASNRITMNDSTLNNQFSINGIDYNGIEFYSATAFAVTTQTQNFYIDATTNGAVTLQSNGTGSVTITAGTGATAKSQIALASSGTITLTGGSAASTGGVVSIGGTANSNVSITPNGTGNLVLDGVNWPQSGGTANYVLTTNGSTQSSWSQVSLTAGVTGTLPLANGGTNAATARDAWDNLTTYTGTNAVTVTLTNASNYIQHIYGGSGTTFTLPSTATMAFGEGFYFVNNSGATATVNTSTSALVGTIPTGTAMRVHVILTNSDAATAWLEMREFETITGTGSAVLATSPTISAATLSGAATSTGSLTLKDIRETVYSAGSTTGTITPDCANGSVQTITLTGSITLNAFANPVSGQTMTLIITQPAAGGPYTLTSTMKFAGASKTLSTAANAIDILTISYIGSTYYASLAKGFA